MFNGTVPGPMRQIVHEHAKGWPDLPIWIGCSGNLTIERVLAPIGRPLNSNDVNAFSCALGWWFAERRCPYRLKEEARELLGWLDPFLETDADRVATLMLGTRFLNTAHKSGIYYQRMLKATIEQFPAMHAKTKAKVEGATLRLASFHARDVREYLDDVPDGEPVAMFPPFFAGDYEQMFSGIDEYFHWPAPEYPELDEAGKDQMVQQVVDRPNWLLGLHVARPELNEFLRGRVQTANRGVPIHLYGATGSSRIVVPRQTCAPFPLRKIRPDQTIEAGQPIRLHVLTGPQFAQLRSMFMAKSIKPGSPLLALGVSVGGRLVGACAYLPPKYDPDQAYLMSDFPVPWTPYRRLAKLVVIAALSTEARMLVQRSLSHRVDSIATTAFSDNPQSSKYGRGIPGMKLASRKSPGDDGVHLYQLHYTAPFGAWSLDEGLQLWIDKHSRDYRKAAA